MAAKRFSDLMLALGCLAAFAGAGQALAEDAISSPMGSGSKTDCQAVQAATDKRVIVDCPADQVFDFCFTRKSVDQADILTGQLEYHSDPSNAAKLPHAPDRIQYDGVSNIATEAGMLRLAGLATISGGTGEFEGATGKLATFGNTDGTGMLIGTICTE